MSASSDTAGYRAGWLTAALLDAGALFDASRSLELLDDAALADLVIRLVVTLAAETGHDLDLDATRDRVTALDRPALIGAAVSTATELGRVIGS